MKRLSPFSVPPQVCVIFLNVPLLRYHEIFIAHPRNKASKSGKTHSYDISMTFQFWSGIKIPLKKTWLPCIFFPYCCLYVLPGFWETLLARESWLLSKTLVPGNSRRVTNGSTVCEVTALPSVELKERNHNTKTSSSLFAPQLPVSNPCPATRTYGTDLWTLCSGAWEGAQVLTCPACGERLFGCVLFLNIFRILLES